MAAITGDLATTDSPDSPPTTVAAPSATTTTPLTTTAPVPPQAASQFKIWEIEHKKELEKKRQAFSQMEQTQREESQRFLEEWCERREKRLQRQREQAADVELPSASTTADGAEPNPPASASSAAGNWRRVVEILGLVAPGAGAERSNGESSSNLLGFNSSAKLPSSRVIPGGTSSKATASFPNTAVEGAGGATSTTVTNCDVSRMQQFLLDLSST